MNKGNFGLVVKAKLEASQEISHEPNYVFFVLHKLCFLCFKVVNQLNLVNHLKVGIFYI